MATPTVVVIFRVPMVGRPQIGGLYKNPGEKIQNITFCCDEESDIHYACTVKIYDTVFKLLEISCFGYFAEILNFCLHALTSDHYLWPVYRKANLSSSNNSQNIKFKETRIQKIRDHGGQCYWCCHSGMHGGVDNIVTENKNKIYHVLGVNVLGLWKHNFWSHILCTESDCWNSSRIFGRYLSAFVTGWLRTSDCCPERSSDTNGH